MKRLAILPALLLPVVASAACSVTAGPTAALDAASGPVAPGVYIVTVKPETASSGDTMAKAMAAVPRSAITHVYRTVMLGFSAKLTAGQLAKVRADPDVAEVTQATVMHLDAPPAGPVAPAKPVTQANPDWGLDRLDAVAGLDHKYTYGHTGKGVTVYVIDSGVDYKDADFGGRASVGVDEIGGDGRDALGHGTHVAGIIGGAKYGVAKGVTIKSVRVIKGRFLTTDTDLIAGMDWVARDAGKHKPAVANISLGFATKIAKKNQPDPVDNAVKAMIKAGVFVAAAAGNDGSVSCGHTLADVPEVFLVASSDKTDTPAGTTDFGPCVDAYAPGVAITSDIPGNRAVVLSGTSMAAPHVTGVAALYEQAFGDSRPADVSNWLTQNAGLEGAVKHVPAGTPNLLLNTGGL